MYIQRISKTLLITASLSVGVLSASFAQNAQEAIIENWVSAAKGFEFLTVSHSGIRHDTASNITTIRNLSIRLTIENAKSKILSGDATGESKGKLEYTIAFPSVEFANLALDNGYYSARSIKADTAELKFDISSGNKETSSSTSGVYDKFIINNIKWAQLPEIIDAPDKPVSKYYPLVEAMIDISFDNALLGGMTMDQKVGDKGINTQITYGPTKIGETVSGNFSEMTMSGMKMQIQASESASPEAIKLVSSDVSFGDISASQYNYGSLVRNFAPGNTGSDNAPYTTVMGDMTVRDMVGSSIGGEFSIDRWAMNDLGVRPPNISVLEVADKLFLEQKATGKEPDKKQIIELVASIYGAFRIAKFELAGLNVDAPGVTQGKLDLYRVSDLSSSGIGEFLIKGINFSGNGGLFNLDLFSIADIKFPALKALMNVEEAGKKNDVAAIMKAIPTVGRYQASGLEVRVPGKGDVALKDTVVEMADFIGPIPTNIDLKVEGLQFPVSMMERKPRKVFSAMGFKDILVSYGLKAVWNEASKVLSMNTKANMKDAGNIDVDVSVGGIPRSAFENPATAQQAVALITVNSANIVFDDQSIVDKGMGIVAAQQGVDVATLKAQAVGLLPFVLQILNKPEFVSDLSETLKKFLNSGGKIRASATPSAPVSVIQLIGVGTSAPGAVIDLLNIKVEAE